MSTSTKLSHRSFLLFLEKYVSQAEDDVSGRAGHAKHDQGSGSLDVTAIQQVLLSSQQITSELTQILGDTKSLSEEARIPAVSYVTESPEIQVMEPVAKFPLSEETDSKRPSYLRQCLNEANVLSDLH